MHTREHAELIIGEIADYRLDADSIWYSYSKSILRTVDNIARNCTFAYMALVKNG